MKQICNGRSRSLIQHAGIARLLTAGFLLIAAIIPGMTGAQTANTTNQITTMGLGELRIGTTLPQLEKLLSRKLPVTKNEDNDYHTDTFKVSYKGIPLEIMLRKDFSKDKAPVALFQLKTSSPLVKTKSGIAIGADKFEVIKKLDGFYLIVTSDGEKWDLPDRKRYSTVSLVDTDNMASLRFYFTDNKLSGFSSMREEGH